MGPIPDTAIMVKILVRLVTGLGKSSSLLFCPKNTALNEFCLNPLSKRLYQEEKFLVADGLTRTLDTAGQQEGHKSLEHSVLNGTFSSNLSPQGYRDLHRGESRKIARARGDR